MPCSVWCGCLFHLLIMPVIESPCVKTCVIDDPSGLCLGCGRSLAEIASWMTMGEAERARIMRELPDRQVSRAPRCTVEIQRG